MCNIAEYHVHYKRWISYDSYCRVEMFCAFSRLLVFFLQINISLLNLQCSRVLLPVKTVYLQRQSNADFAIGGYQSQTLLACISLCLRRAKCRGLDFSDSLQLCQLNGAIPLNVGNFSSDFVGVSLDAETIQQYKVCTFI